MSSLLARMAVRRAHVLVVECANAEVTRIEVERRIRERGWSLATAPAGADALVVCGNPSAAMHDAIERVWEQLPGPRARAAVRDTEQVATGLDDVADALRDVLAQRAEASERESKPDADDIPLAKGGADRDGLDLDELHVPLGPVLAYWPAGLVLNCTLQGDLITGATVESEIVERDRSRSNAHHLDAAARLLTLAGARSTAALAVRARDVVLDAPPVGDGADAATRTLQRSIDRSRSLRWSLSGLCSIDEAQRESLGLPHHWLGDAHDRLRSMTRQPAAAQSPIDEDPRAVLAAIPQLVWGFELAAARLVVASLQPALPNLEPLGANA